MLRAEDQLTHTPAFSHFQGLYRLFPSINCWNRAVKTKPAETLSNPTQAAGRTDGTESFRSVVEDGRKTDKFLF